MRLVEAENLAGLERDCCLGVANLYSIEFHASLFNQTRGLTAGFFEIKRFPINVRDEPDGFKFFQRCDWLRRSAGWQGPARAC